MSEQPYLLQVHPVALAVTGLITAYAVGRVLYATLSHEPTPSTLQRSNAVHRPRRTRARSSSPLAIPRPEGTVSAVSNSSLAYTDISAISGADHIPSQGLRGLLYYIAEDDAKRKAYEHRGIRCEECGEHPIRNIRWHCLNCPDFDLCTACEATTDHVKTHVFAKVKIPLPTLSRPAKPLKPWYPGNPAKLSRSLDAAVKRRLCLSYRFSEPQLDALYDQFTSLSNVQWPNDPCKLKVAIDRRAFDRAVKSNRWPPSQCPEYIFDRIFSFYDTDANGLVGFEEFVSGLAYLRGPERFESLHRAIRGYDMDGDGFVERKDFIRLLKAKFAVQKLLVNEMVEMQEGNHTEAVMGTLMSSQPISSVFSEHSIPQGGARAPAAKSRNVYGDLIPDHDAKTILADFDELHGSREHVRTQHAEIRPGRITTGSFDRFEREVLQPAQTPDLRGITAERPQEAPNASGMAPSHRNDPATIQGDAQASSFANPQEAAIHDVLWYLTEAALNELLDPLFSEGEIKSVRVADTKKARQRWSAEIDSLRLAKRMFRSELKRGSAIDPLLATAFRAFESQQADFPPGRSASGITHKDEVVPTDFDSLAQREFELTERPLDELLRGSGYEVREPNESARGEIPGSSPISVDPTLPQNRPNVTAASCRSDPLPPHQEPAPSIQLLEAYLELDEEQKRIDQRGGPGRLSYAEVESIAVEDTTTELRGIIKSWLELASL